MEEGSQPSPKKGKRNTGKTLLTQAQALEILQQSVIEYGEAGGVVRIIRLGLQDSARVAIVLDHVALDDGNRMRLTK